MDINSIELLEFETIRDECAFLLPEPRGPVPDRGAAVRIRRGHTRSPSFQGMRFQDDPDTGGWISRPRFPRPFVPYAAGKRGKDPRGTAAGGPGGLYPQRRQAQGFPGNLAPEPNPAVRQPHGTGVRSSAAENGTEAYFRPSWTKTVTSGRTIRRLRRSGATCGGFTVT